MPTRRSVYNSWAIIENWLRTNMPSTTLSIPSGAAITKILAAEQEMGIQLPADVREFYALHDGSNGIWVCRTRGYLLPLIMSGGDSSVVNRWQAMKELLDDGCFDGDDDFTSQPNGPIQTDWWNIGWIPITYNECGDYFCVDMVPAKGGRVGQIIDYSHETGAVCVVANSFSEWLSNLADDFEGGKYRINSGALQQDGIDY